MTSYFQLLLLKLAIPAALVVPIKLIDSMQVVNQNICLACGKAAKSASKRPFNLYQGPSDF